LPQTGVDDPTYYFESLGYMVPDRQLDPYYAEFVPLKKNIEIRPHVHPGYEFLYILEGELEIRHADKTHVLTPGDGVYFDASTPHGYRCAGKSAAHAIIVTMHQLQSPQPAMNLRPSGGGDGSAARRVTSLGVPGTASSARFSRPCGTGSFSKSHPGLRPGLLSDVLWGLNSGKVGSHTRSKRAGVRKAAFRV
jgi:mannose-6-phosphate isomerase-like protein (cupin superfamily)